MKLNMMRYELMKKHMELVKSGKLLTAKRLLKFLNEKRIVLGVSDVDWETEKILETIGFRIVIRGRSYQAEVFYSVA